MIFRTSLVVVLVLAVTAGDADARARKRHKRLRLVAPPPIIFSFLGWDFEMRYSAKWPIYAQQWDAMEIKPERRSELERTARRCLAGKPTYRVIEEATGVPWFLVALLHLRESDCDFHTYLGNGQSLNRRTTIVPKGRGPFQGPNAFVDGAIDALKLDGLAGVQDWRLEKLLWHAESYNGLGYEHRGLPSPYIWGGSSIQQRGKFVSDGVFSRWRWDSQPGVAPVLRIMMELDPSIKLEREQ